MADKKNLIETTSIPILLARFTGSTLIALLLSTIYNLADALFISWGVGSDAMGGVSATYPFVLLQAAISVALGSGAASIISRMLGKNDVHEAGKVAFNTMLVFWGSAIIVSIVGLLTIRPVLRLFGVPDELYEYSEQYLRIILLGNIFSTGFSSIMRAEGKMRYALAIWVIPISLNIALDAIFVFHFKLGVAGSALGTVIGQFLSFLMSIFYFWKITDLRFKGAHLDRRYIFETISIGAPSLIQIGSLSLFVLIMNNSLNRSGGALEVNTFAYVNKIITFAVIPFTAITQAASPIIGYNIGAKQLRRVSSSILWSFLYATIYATLATIILYLCSGKILSLLTDDMEIIHHGIDMLKYLSPAVLFIPFSLIIGSAYQASGKRSLSFLLAALPLLLLIPSSLVLQKLFETRGAWLSFTVSNALSGLIAIVISLRAMSMLLKGKTI